MPDRCFACGKTLARTRKLVDTRDDQLVYVGPDCYRKVKAAVGGYRYPGIGPRLFLIDQNTPMHLFLRGTEQDKGA